MKKELNLFDIKKSLPNLPSVDLELVIKDCARLLRIKSIEETIRTIQIAGNPNIRKILWEGTVGGDPNNPFPLKKV